MRSGLRLGCDAEASDTFAVTPTKGCCYRFGACRKGGDVIALVANAKGLAPKAAAETIARPFAGTRTGTVPDHSPQTRSRRAEFQGTP